MPLTRHALKQATRQRIVSAAINVFSECGYHGASIRTVARYASVNEVTLFRYFPKKIDLFMAAIEAAACRMAFPQEFQLKLLDVEHPKVMLSLVFDFLAEVATSQPEILRLLTFAVLESQASASVARSSLQPAFDELAKYLAACMGKGTIRSLDANALSEVLILNGITQLACAATTDDGPGQNGKVMLPSMCSAVWLDGVLASR